jgi:Uma2 family endonuclease
MVSIQEAIAQNRAPSIEQVDPPRPPRETLPTMYDLPSEDPEEPGLPDEFHDLQPQLLNRTLHLSGYSPDRCFTASNLNLYYDVHHPLWHKRPDWFLAVDVPRLYQGTELRRSYVVWQEGQSPRVVVEFLSPGTEAEDLGRFAEATPPSTSHPEPTDEATLIEKPPGKLAVYEDYLRVPHYLVYSRYTRQLRYFKLVGGQYQPQPLAQAAPLIWLPDLAIGLGLWQGEFAGISGDWLRWCDREGTWLLTDTEQAEWAKAQEQLAKEQERLTRQRAEQQAEQERLTRQRAEQQAEQDRLAKEQAEQQVAQERSAKEQAQAQLRQAAQNLLATGMSPSQVAELLGLPGEP